MSTSLTTAAVKEFDSMVKHAYQGSAKLNGTVRTRRGIIGGSVQFPIMAKGTAVLRGTTQTNIIEGAGTKLMNIAHTVVTATLQNYVAAELTDIFDQKEVNFDEKSELASTIAAALGRRTDQIVIDALNAATGTGAIASGSTGLTVAKIISAATYFTANAVPMTDRHFAVTAEAMEDMLSASTITSSDYVTVKALLMGDVNTWMGFKFHIIEARTEGGLTITGSGATATSQCLAFHKSSLGLGIGMEPTTQVNYIPQNVSWLCNGMLKMGAVAIDPVGIIKVAVLQPTA